MTSDEIRAEIDSTCNLSGGEWSILVKGLAAYKCEGVGPHEGPLYSVHIRDADDQRLSNGACLCAACRSELRHGDPEVLERLLARGPATVDPEEAWSRRNADLLRRFGKGEA